MTLISGDPEESLCKWRVQAVTPTDLSWIASVSTVIFAAGETKVKITIEGQKSKRKKRLGKILVQQTVVLEMEL